MDFIFEVQLTISAEAGSKMKFSVTHAATVRVREAEIADVGLFPWRELDVRGIDFLFFFEGKHFRISLVTSTIQLKHESFYDSLTSIACPSSISKVTRQMECIHSLNRSSGSTEVMVLIQSS